MAKFIVVSALLFVAIFALVAEASFRTTINTIVEEEDNEQQGSQQSQRCQQQIQQKQQQLRQCQQWLSQQGSRYGMDDMDEYSRGGQQQQQQQHRQCCQGLESLDRQCRCEAVSQIVQQQQQRQRQGERQEQIVEKARYLPDSCNLEPRQCQVQSPYY